MNKHKAIYSINPNIKRIDELDDNTFVCYDENGNSVETPSIETINAKKAEMISDAENEKQAKENLKASAKAKLIAGEALTSEEADTIVL
tara:strand:- start:1062 stop:1328 length:267 start_codon:yes stop_codon:yes gene_type:complete